MSDDQSRNHRPKSGTSGQSVVSNPNARAELAQRLAGLQGRKKIDAIIDAPNPGALVRSLPAEDLYFTIKEVGLEDAPEIVELASPTQFRTFIDLDAWRRDELAPRALLPWLKAAGDDDDALQAKVRALDIEVIELLLREMVVVREIESDPDYEPTGVPWRSPEGKYLLDFQADGDDLVALKRLVDLYYQTDALQAVRFLEAVRWELPSELQEAALRFRTGRMADLGFPELQDALKLYAFVDPDAPLEGEHASANDPPGFFLETLGNRTFLDQVLALLSGEELSRIDRELLYVLNGALVADGIDPAQLDEVRKALLAARDHLSLGLEYAARGDATHARELLLTVPIARIFQVASGLTLRLKFRADRIVKEGGASFPNSPQHSWFDPPLGPALDALRHKRPRFHAGLEGPTAPAEIRPFSARRELKLVEEALGDAEALTAFVRRIGLDPVRAETLARRTRAESWSDVRLSTLLLHATLMGRGRAPAWDAMPRATLGDAIRWALASTGTAATPALPSDAFRAALDAWVTKAEGAEEKSAAKALLEFVLQRAIEELGPLRDQITPELTPVDLPILLDP